jgi:flagellar motility protein MotE (MotC chaperone)
MPQFLPRLRLLPVILGLAMVMFGMRVNALLEGTHPASPLQLLGDPATAAGEAPATPTAAATAPVSPPAAAAPVSPDAAPKPEPESTAATVPAAETTPAEDDLRDLTEFSSSELSLLQSLRKRREELITREEALTQRERMLKAFELRLDDKIAELNTIKSEIEKTRAGMLEQAKAFEKSKDERIQTLVNVYEKMKPKDAARIFDNLDLKILLDVVRGMKEAKLAPVLAEMNADKATQVTTRLGEKLDIPAVADTFPAPLETDAPAGTPAPIAPEQPQGEAP